MTEDVIRINGKFFFPFLWENKCTICWEIMNQLNNEMVKTNQVERLILLTSEISLMIAGIENLQTEIATCFRNMLGKNAAI